MSLKDVIVFRFDKENKIKEKIKAYSAQLDGKYWFLNKVKFYLVIWRN